MNPYLREYLQQCRDADRRSRAKELRAPVIWRAMSADEHDAALALGYVRFYPGTAAKRLARSLSSQAAQGDGRITDRQAAALWSLVWRFRRQMPERFVRLARGKGHDRSVN